MLLIMVSQPNTQTTYSGLMQLRKMRHTLRSDVGQPKLYQLALSIVAVTHQEPKKME